eukprot:4029403-Prymnesium_polylepis.1
MERLGCRTDPRWWRCAHTTFVLRLPESALAFLAEPTAIESQKSYRNVVRHTCACFERRQLVPLVRHVAGIILRPFR